MPFDHPMDGGSCEDHKIVDRRPLLLAGAIRDRDAMCETLTIVQARCTELLQEARALRLRVKSVEAEVVRLGGTCCDHGAPACGACVEYDTVAAHST